MQQGRRQPELGASGSAGRRRWVQSMAWAEYHPPSSTRAVSGSEVLRLAYQVLNGALKILFLMEHSVVLRN